MLAALIGLGTAMLIDLFLGDPPNRFHPVVLMGSLIRWLAKHAPAGPERLRFAAGVGLALLGGGLFALPWLFLPWAMNGWPVWLQGIILGILLKPMFAVRRLWEAGESVQRALQVGDLPEARRLVAWHLVSRDTSGLDENQVASAAVESLAENLTDSFFAPMLAFALGGLPLAWFYRYINTADAMIGYHTPLYEYLGKFAARLDDVLNFVPARLGASLMVLASAPAGLDVRQAWRSMLEQHARTSSPNAGWTMAAAAGALRVRLEKIGHYCLEGAPVQPRAEDITRAGRLLKWSAAFCLAFAGGTVYVISRLF
jgi:adenosylcobinamide-phosphate synthase